MCCPFSQSQHDVSTFSSRCYYVYWEVPSTWLRSRYDYGASLASTLVVVDPEIDRVDLNNRSTENYVRSIDQRDFGKFCRLSTTRFNGDRLDRLRRLVFVLGYQFKSRHAGGRCTSVIIIDAVLPRIDWKVYRPTLVISCYFSMRFIV